jgi:hypothetical protein
MSFTRGKTWVDNFSGEVYLEFFQGFMIKTFRLSGTTNGSTTSGWQEISHQEFHATVGKLTLVDKDTYKGIASAIMDSLETSKKEAV